MSIAAGAMHSLAVTSDGSLYSWGDGRCGQLGDGISNANSNGTDDTGGSSASGLVAGSSQSPMVAAAIIATALENGHCMFQPTMISALVLRGRHVVETDGGEDGTVAVLNDGSLYVWGNSARGKLGVGRLAESSMVLIPTRVTFYETVSADNGTGTWKSSDRDKRCRDITKSVFVLKCSLGTEHSACVTRNGRVYTWGSGWFGKLGVGHTANCYVPQLVVSLRSYHIANVACGTAHTLAVSAAGDLFSWGIADERIGVSSRAAATNDQGQTRRRFQLTPLLNASFREKSITVRLCSAGNYHSLVMDSDGKIWSFGHGGGTGRYSYGTLGIATHLGCEADHPSMSSTSEPLKVTAMYDYLMPSYSATVDPMLISSADPTSGELALGADGAAFDNGVAAANASSTRDGSELPLDIRMAVTWSNHCIALTSRGQLYTWGCGTYGRLGHGLGNEMGMDAPATKNEEDEGDDEDGQKNQANLAATWIRKRRNVNRGIETTARRIINPYSSGRDLERRLREIRQGMVSAERKQNSLGLGKDVKNSRGRGLARSGGSRGQTQRDASVGGGTNGDGVSTVTAGNDGRMSSGGRSDGDGGVVSTGATMGEESATGIAGGGDASAGASVVTGIARDGLSRTGAASSAVGPSSSAASLSAALSSAVGPSSSAALLSAALSSAGAGLPVLAASRGSGSSSEAQGSTHRRGDESGASLGSTLQYDIAAGSAHDSDVETGRGGTDSRLGAPGGDRVASTDGGTQEGSHSTTGKGLGGGSGDAGFMVASAPLIGASPSDLDLSAGRSQGMDFGVDDASMKYSEVHEPGLLGSDGPSTEAALAVDEWRKHRKEPAMGFVLKCLNAEPSEHLESSLRKVMGYIVRQKAAVYSVLVENENIESSTEEIERNIEWVVKATVGKLYATSGEHAERVPSLEEHGTDVPLDIASHMRILQLEFSLLLVNPGYLIRIYSAFVSDAAHASRRTARSAVRDKNNGTTSDAAGNSNGNSRHSKHASSRKNKLFSDVPDHVIQHPERFVDLVFDVYGDLSLKFNENRFLKLCLHVLQEELASTADRTHGNLALFMSRFASGKTVFCSLVKRYFLQSHITKKASKILFSQLSATLIELEKSATIWGNVLEKRRRYVANAHELHTKELAEKGIKSSFGATADEDGDGIPDEVEKAWAMEAAHQKGTRDTTDLNIYTFDYNPCRVAAYINGTMLDEDTSTNHMNDIFSEDRAVHQELDRRVQLLCSCSENLFGTICRSSDALPKGVLWLLMQIYRQMHKYFPQAIREGGKASVDATKLLISKFVMDNLFVPILTNPRAYGIVNPGKSDFSNNKSGGNSGNGDGGDVLEDDEDKSKKARKKKKKKKKRGKKSRMSKVSTDYLVSANLEILSDTLRHMASVLEFNSKARWLQLLTERARMSRTDSMTWAKSLVRLGGVYDIDTLLVNDMYLAHIQRSDVICSVGLSRVKYLRYCFAARPDALMSSPQDVMHRLMYAPWGIGLLSLPDYLKAAHSFPKECYLSDKRNDVGAGKLERVSLNLRLQIRFLTKRSIAPFLQLQDLVDSHEKGNNHERTGEVGASAGTGAHAMGNGGLGGGGKDPSATFASTAEYNNRKWGDRDEDDDDDDFGHPGAASSKRGSAISSENRSAPVSIQNLYLDTTSGVPLPLFLSSSDSMPVDTTSDMGYLVPSLEEGGTASESYEDGRIAFREVIRSMDSLPNSVDKVVSAILNFIHKHQNLPLEVRDWSKATRFQLAYEFITNTGGGNSGGKSNTNANVGGSGGTLMQSNNQLVDLLCEFLAETEQRKKLAEKLRKEVVRLNKLNAGAVAWGQHLNKEQESARAYLCELLGVRSLSDGKVSGGRASFVSRNQMAKDALAERGVIKKGELTDPRALLTALESQYGEFIWLWLWVVESGKSFYFFSVLTFFFFSTFFPSYSIQAARRKVWVKAPLNPGEPFACVHLWSCSKSVPWLVSISAVAFLMQTAASGWGLMA